jgi:hypothetical protein
MITEKTGKAILLTLIVIAAVLLFGKDAVQNFGVSFFWVALFIVIAIWVFMFLNELFGEIIKDVKDDINAKKLNKKPMWWLVYITYVSLAVNAVILSVAIYDVFNRDITIRRALESIDLFWVPIVIFGISFTIQYLIEKFHKGGLPRNPD